MIKYKVSQPDRLGNNVDTYYTREEAISWARDMSTAAGNGHTYDSDDEALMDFISTHWAIRVEVFDGQRDNTTT